MGGALERPLELFRPAERMRQDLAAIPEVILVNEVVGTSEVVVRVKTNVLVPGQGGQSGHSGHSGQLVGYCQSYSLG
jgi:hypothetical protein